MPPAPLPANESERLKALARYCILDTEPEPNYDELAEIAAYICDTPIALISLVDKERQWFKAVVGIEARETPRDLAFCAYAIHSPQLLIVPDATKDQRFADNPLVLDEPHIRFYAGAPLVTKEGFALGTLCAIDRYPRQLNERQTRALEILAHQVVTQMELRLSHRQLQEYAEELQRLNRNKDRFFSTLAHDLKAPFNGILNLTKILEDEADNLSQEDVKDIAHDIHTASEQAYKLMENLLQWSLFETGGMRCQAEPLSLYEIAVSVIGLLNTIASQKGINLCISHTEDVLVYADRQMVHSVLQNLVTNAIKFTPSGGKVTISFEFSGTNAVVTVADTGIGMNEAQMQYIFSDSFVGNLCPTTAGTAEELGTGLGLLLCRQFVERNGGRIRVTSEIGKGTTFVFTLPLYRG
jgi:signal transduction histidine kinase